MNITFYKQVALGQERSVQGFVFNAKARPFIPSQEMGSQGVDYSGRALSKSAHFPQMMIKNDDLNSLKERLNGLEGASCAELKSLHDEIDSQLAKSMSGKNRLELMLFKALILSRQHQKEEALKVRTQILKEIDDQLAKNMSKRKRLGLMLFKAKSMNRQHRKEEALEVCKQIILLFDPPEPQRDEFESFYEEMNQLRHEKTADLSKILCQLNRRLATGGDTAVQSLKTRLIKAKVLHRMTQNKDALSLCKEIVADRLEDRAGLIVQAKAWNLSGVIYGTLNDREKRLDCYQKGLSLSESIGSLYTAAQALIGLGNARDGNDKVHYQGALNMGKELNDLSIQAQALIGLGNARDGNRIDHYHNALNLGKELNNLSIQAQALMGLGNASRDQDSIDYFKRVLELPCAAHVTKKAIENIQRNQRIMGLSRGKDKR